MKTLKYWFMVFVYLLLICGVLVMWNYKPVISIVLIGLILIIVSIEMVVI